ncbi:hypothetical protein [Verrucomicrobium spinosum]|uniref:hypothetical protein n=1 Tax=Verrucomicrobium spinosum TaxID=2736 RepID=UPI0009464FE6|nr:hypothetical protein [Verrucomicrobium spinosum]
MKPIRKVLAAALLGAAAFFCSPVSATAETLFAGYFDIQTGSPAGAEVNGKIHLLENKNAHQVPIPASHTLAIASDPSGVFELVNQRDSVSRLFGALKVKAGQSVSASPVDYPLTVTLSSGASTLATVNLVVRGVTQPLLNGFLSFASSHALADGDLWGGGNYSDATVGTMLTEIEANNGRFSGYTFYTLPISNFVNTNGALGNQWVEVIKKIGGLGKAYKQSAMYGPGGTPANHTRLKLALYSAMTALLEKFPVDPATVLFNGTPIGTDYGDGFFRLNEKGVIKFNDLSHQWRFTDPMTGPAVWLMPDLLADVRSGNAVATALHEHLVRFFQLSFGNPVSYREINSPGARWGQLTDTNHTEGAFSDANLGHRFRGWVTLPAIWLTTTGPSPTFPIGTQATTVPSPPRCTCPAGRRMGCWMTMSSGFATRSAMHTSLASLASSPTARYLITPIPPAMRPCGPMVGSGLSNPASATRCSKTPASIWGAKAISSSQTGISMPTTR